MLMFSNISKLRYKLITIYLILIIGVLVAVLFITYRSSISIIGNQSIILNDKLLEMGANNLESSIEQIDKIFQALYINSNFKKYLRERIIVDQNAFVDTYNDLKSAMLSLISYRRDVFSIVYIDKSNYMVYTTRKEAGFDRTLLNTELPKGYKDALLNAYSLELRRIVIPTHEHIPINFKVTQGQQKVFTVARKIINIEKNYEYVGMIFINIDLSTFEKIANGIQPYNNTYMYIVSDDGVIVYDSAGKNIGKGIDPGIFEKLNSERGSEEIFLHGRKYIAVYTTCKNTNWKIVNFISINQYSANILLITRVVLCVCVAAIFFSILVILLSTRLITNPIEKLSVLMNKIEIGNMDLRAREKGKDEIAMLSKSFNSLLDKLQNSIRNEYEISLRKKDAEMKALQAQINPHFLYNVLQSISSIAVINTINEISIMAKSLGKMLRYSIKTEENIVSVNDECEHIGNYLAIQKIRYGDKLEYKIDIPQYIRQKSILKLTLQPLVENAIIHGFENKEETNVIYITGELINDYITFEIIDNGIGITSERLNQLRDELNNMQSGFYTNESPSIGLKNVITRLKLFYNGDASISLESESNIGTTVKVKIPSRNYSKGVVLL